MKRREFLRRSSLGAGLMVLPSQVAGRTASQRPPSERPHLALIGVGGRGIDALQRSLGSAEIVALCDVDMATVEKEKLDEDHGAEFAAALREVEKRGARWFSDYRVMFQEMADEIDAVVITTPDHMHYPIALSAINLGKHVYCEKPLTHTVEEARLLTEAAKRSGVVTAMGNQGHSHEGTRLVREWIQSGLIGAVREVHSWTDRPYWPQGCELPDHSKFIPVVPGGMDWELWLGIAEKRPYDPAYAPFDWRGWFDFGTGSLGDMGCHLMDSVYWALDLDYPKSIDVIATPVNRHSFPSSSVVTFQFEARGSLPPLKYSWYDGGLRPPRPALLKPEDVPDEDNGTFIVGERAVLFVDTYGSSVRILPDTAFRELRPELPPKRLPRIRGHHRDEWINAIVEGRAASSDFSYAGPFTEMVLLGNIALRRGERLEWDPAQRRFRNNNAANAFLSKEYPEGWILT